MIKNGFLIENGKIYDTKIQSYKLTTKTIGCNVIYGMEPTKYKRLYLFEPLIDKYDIDKVFDILNHNKYLKKNREAEKLIKINKLHYMSNMAVTHNYPPSYLTPRKFSLYKICQTLKKRLD